MRFSINTIVVLALAAGVIAGPNYKRKDTVTTGDAATAPVATSDPSPDGRCTPCNDHMNQCMGKWPCWFYNCQADCDREVCEQLPECRQGCGFHC